MREEARFDWVGQHRGEPSSLQAASANHARPRRLHLRCHSLRRDSLPVHQRRQEVCRLLERCQDRPRDQSGQGFLHTLFTTTINKCNHLRCCFLTVVCFFLYRAWFPFLAPTKSLGAKAWMDWLHVPLSTTSKALVSPSGMSFPSDFRGY